MSAFSIPLGVTGIRLCKVVNDDLRMTEVVQFERGHEGVDTVLRRAALSGRVGPMGDAGDYWADLMNANGEMEETIALDRASWNALKNHWMRCRMWNLGASR